jgi:hypothetical protein
MGLADAAIRGIVDSVAFRASAVPYLILDTELRIWAANTAYLQATLQDGDLMRGEEIFDVFPDNPETPEAHASERLGRSLERALVSGAPDRMPLQRYDVRDPRTGAFVERSWLPVNRPIRDADGRTVGVLHHVEDVTHLLIRTALEHVLETGEAPARPGVQRSAEWRLDAAARHDRALRLTRQSHVLLDRLTRPVGRDRADDPAAGPGSPG